MTTLKEQIQTRHIRYRLDKAAVLCLRGGREVPVMRDGVASTMKEPPVFIGRVGDGKMGPFTNQYDVSEPEMAEFVRFVDNWIEKNPSGARSAGLSKLNDERPPAKILNWDNMDVEQIAAVLEATRVDLTWAMEFELLRPSKVIDITGAEVEGGPREEVLDLIENIYSNGFQADIEISEEAPVL